MSQRSGEPRFLVDRMLGTLTRYLRFMGYDTWSASALGPGDPAEDTRLLAIAEREGRILITRDAELARRGGGRAVLVRSNDVLDQVEQLTAMGFIVPAVRMRRCSLCNTPLRPATEEEVRSTPYAPRKLEPAGFFWCRRCRKLYWEGSHSRNLSGRLERLRQS